MLKLEILNPEQAGKRIAINGELKIGSDRSCSLRAKHRDMRPVHAVFNRNAKGKYTVEVVDEDAHIFLNGRDIIHSELQHQDLLAIGPLKFRVIDEQARRWVDDRLSQLLDTLEEDDTVYDFATEDLFYLITKEPSLQQAIAFRIPSRDRFIDQCQQFLARLIRKSGMDEMKIEAFMTCTKELILNAHRHGHEYDESKVIVIRYRDDGEAVWLTIEDEGEGFDHNKALSEVRNMDAASAARLRYQSGGFGGLGFQMITRMSDSIEYNEKGNVVTFSVRKEF